MPRGSVRWMKVTSNARRGARTKKGIGGKKSPNCLDRHETQRHRLGDQNWAEIARSSAVMAKRKANLAVVVRPRRRLVAGGHTSRQDAGRAPQGKRERVMVPTDQHRLQEDRKNPEKRRSPTRRRQLRFGVQTPCHQSRTHFSQVRPSIMIPWPRSPVLLSISKTPAQCRFSTRRSRPALCLMIHMRRRRTGRLPPGPIAPAFSIATVTLRGPACSNESVSGKDSPSRSGRVRPSNIMCIPPGLRAYGLPSGHVHCGERAHSHDASLHRHVCSSAFFATGDEAAVRRSVVGETIVK
jgi:hypothetical protein